MSTSTRPDIAFDVCDSSVAYTKAKIGDLLNLNKVIGKVSSDHLKLFFPNVYPISDCILECYSDASFANLSDSGSQGGFIIFMKNSRGMRCPLLWQSRKIRRVVKSTLAAETLALLECAEAAVYLKEVISDILKHISLRIKCFVDNKSIVDNVNSTKNVDDRRLRIDIAVLKSMLENKEIESITWIESSLQLADSLTKKGANSQKLRAALTGG